MRKTADTSRYRLVPTDRKEIIQSAIAACLAVGGFFGIVYLTAFFVRMVS